ncbi:hypothetical protein Avbf_03305 [Armadillidium vulgare]|nr:hypothetical protein Avbf_03305 [Armadillidium vulgare]
MFGFFLGLVLMPCEGVPSLYQQQGNCPQNVDNYGSLCSQTPEINDCVLGNSDPNADVSDRFVAHLHVALLEDKFQVFCQTFKCFFLGFSKLFLIVIFLPLIRYKFNSSLTNIEELKQYFNNSIRNSFPLRKENLIFCL